MQNFIDTWSVILDDKGRPLVGKIGFYEPDTTQLKDIFATDETTPLDNPIYCNAVTTNQVLLQDGDYTIRYWRYIGNGNMESDQNEESWLLYKTELYKDGSVSTSDFSDGAACNTIEELKQMSGMEDGDIILVHGYYDKDDCPDRYFVWHASSTTDDDGGICIQSDTTNTGRWIMKIPGTYIDVRWYGDMPGSSLDETTSNLGQRSKAAQAANRYKKDLYFPSFTKGTSTGFYTFNGSNTVSVTQNIICDSGVRFIIKHGTSGSVISCSQFLKEGKYLFVSESGQTIGGYELRCDWIKSSWLHEDTTAPTWATQGYILDEMNGPLTLADTKIRIETNPYPGCSFDNCQITECNKLIDNIITLSNMEVDTDWFEDTYDWGDLTLSNCKIDLVNCKDANTYIILKNKQNDGNYGDLGEQAINATVVPDCIIENCSGSITLSGHGSLELHNVSLTINGLNGDSINAVDSWLTINDAVTLNSIQLRRGELNGTGNITLSSQSYFDNASILIVVNTDYQIAFYNSTINANIGCKNVVLEHNQILQMVTQTDVGGVITVNCCRNHFSQNGRHYIYSEVADGVVTGQWIGNSCSYDTMHWIKINRTNLKVYDYMHSYSYVGNEEPFIDKWNGLNTVMYFSLYKGNKDSGTGVFSTNMPILFWNDKTNAIYAVNKSLHWKMFTVGRAYTRRTCSIIPCSWADKEGQGTENGTKPRLTPIVWNWGCRSGNNRIMECWCLDGTGDADYDWSFERSTEDHTQPYSYGILVGYWPVTPDYNTNWKVYPAATTKLGLCVKVDKDFRNTITCTKQE